MGSQPSPGYITARVVVDERDCWIWRGPTNGRGYGRAYIGGRIYGAHRLSYQIHVGAIPDGTEIDHLCRVTLCCNPAHLEPVTHRVNMARGRIGAHYGDRTHCDRGHPYTGTNLMIRQGGGRRCRTCQNEAARAAKARARQRSR